MSIFHLSLRLGAVVLVTVVLAAVAFFIFTKLQRRAKTTGMAVLSILFHMLKHAVPAILACVSVTVLFQIWQNYTGIDWLVPGYAPVRDVLLIAIVALALMTFSNQLKRLLVYKFKRTESMGPRHVDTVRLGTRIFKLLVIVVAALAALDRLGVNITGVIAFGGLGGLIAGLAAKDVLTNYFGSLILYIDRPFDEGDWILLPDDNLEGTVEEISWRATRIRTFQKRSLYVPNAYFLDHPVENPSRMTHRRIYEYIGIRYADAGCMATIIDQVRDMLRNHPEIDATQTIIVNFDRFAASSLDFFIYTFTRTTDWIKYHQVKQDVLLQVLAIIEQNGAKCAFPTSSVFLHTKGKQADLLTAPQPAA